MNKKKVFISHKTKDRDIVSVLKSYLDLADIQAYIAEEDYQYGTDISKKIKKNIDDSDVFIAILARDESPFSYVDQEIGYWVLSQPDKQIILIVDDGVKPGGLLTGKEYTTLDRSNLSKVFTRVTQDLKKNIPRIQDDLFRY